MSRPRSTGAGQEVGPSVLASRIRSPTSRDIRSTLVEQQVAGLGDLVRVVGVEQLEVAAQDRERRLQLVAGVVEELPLVGEAGVEPLEHR